MACGAKAPAVDNAAVVARLSAVLENPAALSGVPAVVTLLSSVDGSAVPAATVLLASCSPVFLALLTGGFAVAHRGPSKDRETFTEVVEALEARGVETKFTGEALAAVVAFAGTNDAPVLADGGVGLLVEVLEAAEYYKIDGLRRKVHRRLVEIVGEEPAEACGLLEAVWPRWAADSFGAGSMCEVAEAALVGIDGAPHVALANCACLCEGAMKMVMDRPGIDADEATLFKVLRRWVSFDEKRRKSAGERLVSCLSLYLMPPTFLENVVAKSGLVSEGMLGFVFRKLAVKAEVVYGMNSISDETQSGRRLLVDRLGGRRMTVYVRWLTGKTIPIEVLPSDTILDVKRTIQGLEGIPSDRQALIFAGMQLEDWLTCRECGIRKDSTFHLVVRRVR